MKPAVYLLVAALYAQASRAAGDPSSAGHRQRVSQWFFDRLRASGVEVQRG